MEASVGLGNMSLLPRRDHRHMTVSRLERPAAENIFFALTCDPGEIRDLAGGRADASEQRQAVGTHR
ncbi:hypothetical protein, partial [Mesorhizobium sp. M7A.T.Ca.TU.009.02.1.1]|uniref:hypothetical protein n=1 Tax=Mesorhizobium sp. M7A.T.Ca.TU.009.02.1.1 TaxID=2496791 RepID=UPI0019D0ABE2